MLVIAKAYGDEPLVRVLTGCQSGLAYVLNPDGIDQTDVVEFSGVGFPQGAVFKHDPELADSLAVAWRNGDAQAIATLWSRATPLMVDA